MSLNGTLELELDSLRQSDSLLNRRVTNVEANVSDRLNEMTRQLKAMQTWAGDVLDAVQSTQASVKKIEAAMVPQKKRATARKGK